VKEEVSSRQIELFETHKAQNWTAVKKSDLNEFTDEWLIVRDDKAYHTIHRFHPYFAMCPPPIARRAIERYSKPGDLVLDPFCGAGVTMVEANLTGRNAVGMDILSIAVLISKVKTTPIEFELKRVPKIMEQIKETYSKLHEEDISLPEVYNIDYWFTKEVQRQLSAILKVVLAETDPDIKDFLRVCFSSIIRRVSRSTDMETHLHLKKGKPAQNALKRFEERLYDMSIRMAAYKKLLPSGVKTQVICMDNRDMLNLIRENSVDYGFTSPPYGTGTKYASVYRLQMQLLQLDKPVKPHEQAKDFSLELGKTFTAVFKTIKPGGYFSILYGTSKSFSSADVLAIAREQGFIYKETILCPIIDESKMVRGDYKRSMPNEYLITVSKPEA
jgi:DNA modification methylase